MMIFSLVAMTGLEKCCITSAYLQWLCHSGERPVAHGPLVKQSNSWVMSQYDSKFDTKINVEHRDLYFFASVILPHILKSI